MTKHNPIKYCRVCKQQLIPDDNWTKGLYTRSNYICKDCKNRQGKDWRDNNPIKAKNCVQNSIRKKPNRYRHIGRKYRQTKKGRCAIRKQKARRRGYDAIELFENPFPDNVPIDWHHISDAFVVAIPRYIHKNHYGKNHREELKPYVEEIYNITYVIEN